MELEEFAVNPKLYEDGKKIPLGKDCYIRLRSAGSTHAQKVRERLWKPYATWEEIPQDILDGLNAQWVAEGLLTEFVGFTIDGKPLTVDLGKADDQNRLAKVFGKPEYKAVARRFIRMSFEDKQFQDEGDEVLEKNSGRSRAGSSSGASTQSE